MFLLFNIQVEIISGNNTVFFGADTRAFVGIDMCFQSETFHSILSLNFTDYILITSSPLSPAQITAFDELQADFKVPIDQGNPLHAVGLISHLSLCSFHSHVSLDYCLTVHVRKAIVGTYGKRFQSVC